MKKADFILIAVVIDALFSLWFKRQRRLICSD